jgi:hypothetical protein
LLDFEHAGIKYTAGIGRFEDGRMAEIFLHATKQGTAIDVNARDAAVAASLLLAVRLSRRDAPACANAKWRWIRFRAPGPCNRPLRRAWVSTYTRVPEISGKPA